MKKVLLSGYYGFDNFGDEAILYSMLTKLSDLNLSLEIGVLSNKPAQTRASLGVPSWPRWPLPKVLPILRQADYLITGGGSLLQDITGWRSIPYYLGLTCLARFFRLKNILFAVGVGPVAAPWQRKLLKKFVEKLDFISVRDEESLKFLRELGIEEEITLIPDPVFLLTNQESLLEESPYLPGGSAKEVLTLVLSPRTSPKGVEDSHIWVEIIEALQGSGKYKIILWPLHSQEDMSLCQSILSKTKGVSIWEGLVEPLVALDLLKSCDLLIGVRYHSLIFGALAGCSLLGISYDPKVTSLLKQLGLPAKLELESLRTDLVLQETKKILANLPQQKALLQERIINIRKEGQKGYERLAQFLRGD